MPLHHLKKYLSFSVPTTEGEGPMGWGIGLSDRKALAMR